ncbi:hypothetical protein EDEG_03119 [Edhazardia aedis USNM 41457]|uniref:Uncharacterized protein n=1 Tax=Edhazardia aedis (strain USNM 41457) TaxID=1003232 RepID=J9DIM6_EDHAE|nr:hypothetical protein EDEG_03119 [Edhazardia aedis USNM 41457]|eukprot:EJW02465.1 hypothetical protein EDEG_03119 [Edhazardia aedis USNM 41457]
MLSSNCFLFLLYFKSLTGGNIDTEHCICYNIDKKHIYVECIKYIRNKIKENIKFMISNTTNCKEYPKTINYFKNVCMTDESYTRIINNQVISLVIDFQDDGFFCGDYVKEDFALSLMSCLQSKNNLGVSEYIKVPEIIRNREYKDLIYSLLIDEFTYERIEYDIIVAFFKLDFCLNENQMIQSVFFTNLQTCIEDITFQRIHLEIKTKGINVHFEDFSLFADPEKLSKYIKNVIDTCHMNNTKDYTIFFKFSTEFFLASLFANSHCSHIDTQPKTTNTEKSEYSFEMLLNYKLNSFLNGELKKYTNKQHKDLISNKKRTYREQMNEFFIFELSEHCFKQKKQNDSLGHNAKTILENIDCKKKIVLLKQLLAVHIIQNHLLKYLQILKIKFQKKQILHLQKKKSDKN